MGDYGWSMDFDTPQGIDAVEYGRVSRVRLPAVLGEHSDSRSRPACQSTDTRVGQRSEPEVSYLPRENNRLWSQEDVAYPRSSAPSSSPWRPKKKARLQLILASRVTSTVISVIKSMVSSYSQKMTLKDLRLGFSKRPYLQRSIKMATQGELLKLYHFLP